MINSRNLNDLDMRVRMRAEKHRELCAAEGIDLLIYCTYRDEEAQAAEYAKGRTLPGPIRTYAKPGYSMHQYKLAYDCVPMRNGKPVWNNKAVEDAKLWRLVGELGERAGLTWAGRWTGKLKETAHFQWTGGLTIEELREGKRP